MNASALRSFVVYCLDVGKVLVRDDGSVLPGSTFAWARVERDARGEIAEHHGNDPRSLVDSLGDDLAKRALIALGVEAPMWFPRVAALQTTAGAVWRLFRERFQAETGHEWSRQAGASASVRAPQLLWLALNPLLHRGLQFDLVTSSTDWNAARDGETVPILVWEAFCVAGFKPNYDAVAYANLRSDEADAVASAMLFHRFLENGAEVPANPQDGPILVSADPNAPTFSLWSWVADLLGLDPARCDGRSYTVGATGCVWPEE